MRLERPQPLIAAAAATAKTLLLDQPGDASLDAPEPDVVFECKFESLLASGVDEDASTLEEAR